MRKLLTFCRDCCLEERICFKVVALFCCDCWLCVFMIYGRISLQNNAFLIAFSVVFLQWPLQLLEHADHANQLVERLVYIHSQFCTALDQWNSELLCQVLRFIPANLQKPVIFLLETEIQLTWLRWIFLLFKWRGPFFDLPHVGFPDPIC